MGSSTFVTVVNLWALLFSLLVPLGWSTNETKKPVLVSFRMENGGRFRQLERSPNIFGVVKARKLDFARMQAHLLVSHRRERGREGGRLPLPRESEYTKLKRSRA